MKLNEQGLKTEVVTVPEWGERDRGKYFLITEMPAAQAEKWGLRMVNVLKGTSAVIPQTAASLGMVGVAIIGLNAWLAADIDPAKLEPLMDQMMTCVSVIRDPRHPDVATPIVSDSDIMEIRTRLWLRSEILQLHTGFSPAEMLSRLISAIQTSKETTSTT